MPAPLPVNGWQFLRFGLIVTGRGEHEFLAELFRSLTAKGQCHFRVIRRVEQLRPIQPSSKRGRKLNVVGTRSRITTGDEDLGLAARGYLESTPCSYVIMVDDLEHAGVPQIAAVFGRYRAALDTILKPRSLDRRASVHLLVNMLEAYYFADAKAINAVLGTTIADSDEDVETIRHPKNDLKRLCRNFDQVQHGAAIVAKLDVRPILSRPETCAGLRALFGWCWKALGRPLVQEYRLDSGIYSVVTGPQLGSL